MKTETTLDVIGMTCGSCARRVRDALAGVDGVEDVIVQLSTGNVQVEYDTDIASVEALTRALDEAGYPAKSGAEAIARDSPGTPLATPQNKISRTSR